MMGRPSILSPSLFLLLLLLLLLFLLSLSCGQRSNAEGEKLSCDRCDWQLCCDCSHEGFDRVPMVTDQALTLDLSFNNISVVTQDDLIGHARLRVLSLHGNRIAEIHPSAFDSLWNLEELDLSNNQLTALNNNWFKKLGALQQLNVLSNPYRTLGSPPVFQGLVRLRKLAFGSDVLVELRRGDLTGVTQLEELTVHANNLQRYEPGTLMDIWPLGRVTLSLYGPFFNDTPLAAAVLSDVSYSETPVIFSDLHLIGNDSIQPLRETAKRRVRTFTFRNLSVSDEAIIELLKVSSGSPLTSFLVDNVTLTGEGRWTPASLTDHKSIDEFFVRKAVVLDVFQFVSFVQLQFLLQYPRRVSVIDSKVFLLPCKSSRLMVNMQYLDLSDNLLTDMTLDETMCQGDGSMKSLRVLNISGNALKSLSTLSRLVTKLYKLKQLDVSRNVYNFMPQQCSWPFTLQYLNISSAKLMEVTSCLPTTLQVLDLSNNDLQTFVIALPLLRELHLSGNKFQKLPSGWFFPNLQILAIQSNTLNMFGHSDLKFYKRLQNLQASQNKFVCSCDFVSFLQSTMKRGEAVDSRDEGAVHLTDGIESYICDSPLHFQGKPVREVHPSVVECHRVLFVSVSCGLALVLGILLIVLLWRLHAFWYLKMTWAWLKAKRSSTSRRRRRQGDGTETEPLLCFDAFVSYSERDASWVDGFLVPELENPSQESSGAANNVTPLQPLSLCLHKRDFLPGQWIVDNIMSAMERSRRTVFVLSENFVSSDWCRYELDFSHFRLFDGKDDGDTAILILLEPLSKDDIPKRFCKLRKLMNSTTYLEWPQDEERRPEFWRSLRNALRGQDEEEEQ